VEPRVAMFDFGQHLARMDTFSDLPFLSAPQNVRLTPHSRMAADVLTHRHTIGRPKRGGGQRHSLQVLGMLRCIRFYRAHCDSVLEASPAESRPAPGDGATDRNLSSPCVR
jgi:hypothetical protein